MAVTVDSLCRLLSGRCGSLYTTAGLDGTATSSAWLDPLASAARALGYTLSDPTTITDADLAGVTQDQVAALVDVGELRALETALNNYLDVDQTISLGTQKLDQIRTGLQRTIDRKTQDAMRVYGIGLTSLSVGHVALSFQASSSDDTIIDDLST